LYRQLSGLTIDDDLGEAKPNLDVGCSSLGNIPEDIQVSGNSTTEKNESLKLAIESKAWGIHADDESVMSSEYHERYQSVYLVAEIEALEDLLDEEERQLEDLQDEVDRCKKKNCELINDCRAKRHRINRLEEEYGELKVVLAESRANEDNLELQLSRLVMERDLQVLNLTNDYNQLYCALRQAQRENEQYRKATAKVNRKFERQSRGFRDSAHGYEASWGLF
jgi:chromosome segregation ATPase